MGCKKRSSRWTPIIVPKDPFGDPIPWLELAAKKFEEEDAARARIKRNHKMEIEDVEPFYSQGDGDDLDHVIRVRRVALWLAEKLGGALEIVNAAALLLDIARKKEIRNECMCHAEEGARIAAIVLGYEGFNEDQIKRICHCIGVHHVSEAKEPISLEAKIIQDAERLDALGAIGIARALVHTGSLQLLSYNETNCQEDDYHDQRITAVNRFFEKILGIHRETFHTEPARRIAENRYAIVEQFFQRFISEWSGHDLLTVDE